MLAGAVLLASLARRRWGERAGAIAGVCYVLASVGLVPEDTQAATFEVFMLPVDRTGLLVRGPRPLGTGAGWPSREPC